MNTTQLLAKFGNFKKAGAGYLVHCPSHEDDRPSLSIGTGDNGAIVMYCHAGCEPAQILAKIGLQMKDLYPPKQNLPPGIAKTYDYTDVAGKLLYQVCRKHDKTFLQRRPDGSGGWIWKTGKAVKRVPYRLHELAGHKTVYVVEGEKDADRLWSIGLPATTNAGGAGKWGASESKALRDVGVTRVVIIPDNDEPGVIHANEVAQKCKKVGLAQSIVMLPGLSIKEDVSDWLAQGHDREELEELVNTTPYLVPPPQSQPGGSTAEPVQTSSSQPIVESEASSQDPDALADPTKYAPSGGDGTPYDIGAAEAFRDRFGDRVRYDHTQERWLIWQEHFWRPDESGEVKLLAKRHIDLWQQEAMKAVTYPLRRQLVNFTLKLDKKSSMEGMMSCATWQTPISTSGTEWDANGWLLGVRNGVVDLRTGQLRSGQRTDWITQQAGALYDPQAQCPRWIQFLEEVLDGNAVLIDYVHKALGYSLTGDMREQCFFLAIGGGANGKSIFLDTLETVWGSYGHRANMRIFVGNDGEKFHLAELDKRRLIFASETKPNTRMNEHVVKNFTGGESQSAERKFGQPFTFKPIGKLWLGVNHQPKIVDDSFGFWRRVRMIPFLRTFVGSVEDRGLKDKLKLEAPGILAWTVQGCLKWQTEGLETPEVVRVAVEDYQNEEDPLTEFFAERCIIEPNSVVTFSALFAAYNTWAESQGISPRDRLSRRAMGNNLKRRFDTKDSDGMRRYEGIELKPAHVPVGHTPSMY
jgi:putative DNA primase/helicase